MASMTPCKNWMRAGRLTVEYMEGVVTFLKYVKQNSNGEDWHSCPCAKCCNIRGKMTLETISEHLVFNGIDQTYTTWFLHGEQRLETSASTFVDNRNEDVLPRMVDLVNDAFGHFQPIELDACMDEVNNGDDIEAHDELGDEARYRKLMEDAKQPLYPSCKPEHTKLSVTVELLSMKARFRWSDNSFTELLNLLKKILPNENSLPNSTYNAMSLISSLGMNYETIHACPNDCILYWKDHVDKQCCPKCGASRWKFNSVVRSTAPHVPCKVLRYFPLTPRLKRLYTIPEIAENMIWHSKSAQDDIYMRHPVDSSMWKIVDEKYADFAAEPRNVRLGLATDGFNPFGNMSNSYSCWPVMIVTYNLPPHLCMRKEFTMLTLLIPGKKGPGHDIDVYLQPLIAELLELWK
ncbi:uncharacterized protein LOC131225557 [Magnolia sinica]|uniref:uncharacterized protein LOC131225557 n=1 Tax=Magnolia sinica TaxID=86752 RepID=UPI002657C559|nr:uncharacterized protein LOC131225557 [Magnolia sinica]